MIFTSRKLHNHSVLLLTFFLFLLPAACSNETENETGGNCGQCHMIELDEAHAFQCSRCHGGDESGETKEIAHAGLIAQPAHPDQAQVACSPCHPDLVTSAAKNAHYLLPSYASMTSNDITEEPRIADQIRSFAAPASGTELFQDDLARKCMRCHVYTRGDDFPLTARATGCGACHLEYYDGVMTSHRFVKYPKDAACLSCHYGNRVGFDYYGRFEHDLNEEYRTPYTTREEFFRPYGVEYHNLEPDVHQRAGLVCTDCHRQAQLMGAAGSKADCRSCHDLNALRNNTQGMVNDGNGQFTFRSQATGKSFTIPPMVHPVHEEFQEKFSCQACHAQWSFNDRQTHLLRIDHDYFDEFEKLTLDGDSHTRRVIFSNIDFDSETIETRSRNLLTGESLPGIWVQGYLERRWETINLIPSGNGTIHVSRPILDLYISWVDLEETARFDNFRPFDSRDTVRPYTPHTIGHAGAFFMQRLSPFLSEREPRTRKQNN